jgi:hypothetical protein
MPGAHAASSGGKEASLKAKMLTVNAVLPATLPASGGRRFEKVAFVKQSNTPEFPVCTGPASPPSGVENAKTAAYLNTCVGPVPHPKPKTSEAESIWMPVSGVKIVPLVVVVGHPTRATANATAATQANLTVGALRAEARGFNRSER